METYGNEAPNTIKCTLSTSIGCTNSSSGGVLYGAETRVAVRECLMHSAMRKETLRCDLLKILNRYMAQCRLLVHLYGTQECLVLVNTYASKWKFS